MQLVFILRVQMTWLFAMGMQRLLSTMACYSLIFHSLFYQLMICFIAGYMTLSFPQQLWEACVVLGTVLVCWQGFLATTHRAWMTSTLLLALAGSCGGYMAFHSYPASMQLKNIPAQWLSEPQTVIAVVASAPRYKQNHLSVRMRLQQIQGMPIHSMMYMSWYGYYPPLWVGQTWRLRVHLRRSSQLQQAGQRYRGFGLWLQAQHMPWIGTVVSATHKHTVAHKHAVTDRPILEKHRNLLPQSNMKRDHSAPVNLLLSSNIWLYPLQYFRQAVAVYIRRVVDDPELAAMLVGFCVGLRSTVSKAQWQVLTYTGTNHLIAIAGLHLGTLLLWLQKLLRQSNPCIQLYTFAPVKIILSLLALCAMSAYAELSGFSIPAQRTLGMYTILTWAIICRRHVVFTACWLIVMCTLICANPLVVYEAAFWLSFTAVAVVHHCWKSLEGSTASAKGTVSAHTPKPQLPAVHASLLQAASYVWRHIRLLCRLQLGLFVGLLPLTIYFFHVASLWMIPANLIAVPYIACLVLPLSWLGCLLWLVSRHASVLVLHLAATCLHPLWLLLQYFSCHHVLVFQRQSLGIYHLILSMLLGWCGLNLRLAAGWRYIALLFWAGSWLL